MKIRIFQNYCKKMERKKDYLLLLVFLILAILSPTTAKDDCRTPTILKKTIIKTEESIENGAELLGTEIVPNARECFQKCCSNERCTTAVMHYKQIYDEYTGRISRTEKICYLFACGASPSVCSFSDHSSYAVIILNRNRDNPSTVIPKDENRCPPGVPVAMCSDDPCTFHECAANKNARCKANYCGGCNAVFYNEDNSLANCKLPTKEPIPDPKVDDISPNEQSVEVGSTDYDETPSENLPLPAKRKIQSQKPAQNGDDPYFATDRRVWITELPGENKEPINATTEIFKSTTIEPISQVPVVVRVQTNLKSVPLLVALIICILLVIALIYHFKCARKGKVKKLPVDDGDYLINGMYL